MKKSPVFSLTTTKKYFFLSLIVLLIGVPINYQLFSHWRGLESIFFTAVDKPISNRTTRVETIPTISLVSSNVKQSKNLSLSQSKIVDQNASLRSLRRTRDNTVVQLSKFVVNSLGVKTVEVERTTIYRQINSIGHITVNEKKIRMINLRTEGWIEILEVNSVGDRVSKGDLLLKVYSPKLVTAQEDYLHMLGLEVDNEILLEASKQRLLALGVSESQIEILRSNRKVEPLVSVYAPQDGFVLELFIREGGFVSPSTSVLSLVDLSSVWLLVDIFENKASWVKQGQNVEARLPFLPGKIWRGSVDFVYPSLDSKTRSIKARLRFENSDELLKPNMYANVSIFTNPKLSVLTIPREAVIKMGHQSRVIVAKENGKFKPAVIQTGIETDTKVEILSGLKSGEKVVISSQFLIDSESSKQASMLRLMSY